MIKNENFGQHEGALFVELGNGDVSFTRARFEDEQYQSMLIFHNADYPRNIGETSHTWNGKDTDELPKPDLVMVFKNPESINALVHSLMELQRERFGVLYSDRFPSKPIPRAIIPGDKVLDYKPDAWVPGTEGTTGSNIG